MPNKDSMSFDNSLDELLYYCWEDEVNDFCEYYSDNKELDLSEFKCIRRFDVPTEETESCYHYLRNGNNMMPCVRCKIMKEDHIFVHLVRLAANIA